MNSISVFFNFKIINHLALRSIVDVWYLIPFPRYLLNSIVVSTIAVIGNVIFNASAAYALTRPFPGRRQKPVTCRQNHRLSFFVAALLPIQPGLVH